MFKKWRTLILLSTTSLLLVSISTATAQVRDHIPRTDPIASYDIDVTLDVEQKSLVGTETITYVNTTDDPIPTLIFHLYLNGFRNADSYFMSQGGHRGFDFDMDAAGFTDVTEIALIDGTPLELELLEDGTLAEAKLPKAVAPNESVRLTVSWEAQLPKVSARTGYAGDFFLVGQWFPKLGVWEDGAWNAYPFYPNNEFYANFGTYDVDITLPENYKTGATGLLANETFADGLKTVSYHAEQVIDFAFVASPNLLSEIRNFHNIEVEYLYLPEHEDSVERVFFIAEKSIASFQHWFGEYAYETLSIIDVPDDGQGAGGMEYPMFVTAGSLGADAFLPVPIGDRVLEVITAHEIGHQWFQTMVATNEVEEPWLDEGFTDYAGNLAMTEAFGDVGSFVENPLFRASAFESRRAEFLSQGNTPMFGTAESLGDQYPVAAYSKPSMSLRTLERTLGPELFRDVMRTYFERWRFKHPTTEDFRAVAQEVTGEELDWFFEGLVYGDGMVNYVLGDLTADSVTLLRQGTLSVPTEVEIIFKNGERDLIAWDGIEEKKTFTFDNDSEIIAAEIDPERKLSIELKWSDNGRSREPDTNSWFKIFTRFFYDLQDALIIFGGL